MNELGLPSLLPGDVIFTRSADWRAFFSPEVQTCLDPVAKPKGRINFSHVSISTGSMLAVEAVPAESRAKPKPNWSGVELEPGVRLIPAGDLFASSIETAVLRSPRAKEVSIELYSPKFGELMGSAYSLASLKRPAELFLGKVSEAIGALINPVSIPKNIGALLLDEDLRAKISQAMPHFRLSFENHTYYCSELVLHVLNTSGLFVSEYIPGKSTPIGLYKHLSASGWDDVTDSDCSPSACEKYLNTMRAEAAASYYSKRLLSEMYKRSLALEETVKFVSATVDQVKQIADDELAKLDRYK